MFPLTRGPLWYRFFEPQPFGHRGDCTLTAGVANARAINRRAATLVERDANISESLHTHILGV